MPSRRTILRATTLGLAAGVAGCLGDGDGDGNGGGSTPTSSPTDTHSGSPGTPMALPDDCPPPAFDGAPAVPEKRDATTMEAFAREFERVYQKHALPDHQRLLDVDIDDVHTAGGGYVIELNGEAEQVPPEDGTSTPTPQPIDARVWDATYRVKGTTVERTLYGTAGGRELQSDCWTVDESSENSMQFPDECAASPDVDGLPALPQERTEETMSAFVDEFERTYKASTASEDRRVDTVSVTEVDPVGDGYLVRVQVDMAHATAAPGEETPSPMPTDSGLYITTYRISGQRVHREESLYAGGTAAEDCWTIEIVEQTS